MSLALLFPGQGSQIPGMGRALADSDPEIMDIWKQSERISGLPLREICWEGDEAALADTRNLQPALTTLNICLWSRAAGRVRPACAAGHSLGEFSALAASGALSLKDAISIVTLRGQLMADADPAGQGAMAAVLKLPFAQVESLAAQAAASSGELLIVANRNTPAQFVVSGTRTAVAAMAELVKAAKGRAVPLAVSGAFHSPLMQAAAAELARALAGLHWNRPRFPIYANLTGTAVSDGLSLAEIMPQQMTSPVLWIDSVRNMYAAGVRDWLELGPKAVVSKMVTACLDGISPLADKGGPAGDAETDRSAAAEIRLFYAGTGEQIAALPDRLGE